MLDIHVSVTISRITGAFILEYQHSFTKMKNDYTPLTVITIFEHLLAYE